MIGNRLNQLLTKRREQREHVHKLEDEVACITLIPGSHPEGMRMNFLKSIEVPDPWKPDAARRLIKHQALMLGATHIIHYIEEPDGDGGEIQCRGMAVILTDPAGKS